MQMHEIRKILKFKWRVIMNIAFFLTPKNEIVYEKTTATMRQAIERMEYHTYTAIPVIDEKGRYAGTLTEGDLLREFKKAKALNLLDSSKVKISEIEMRVKNKPVNINTDMEELIETSIQQNFVPVIDDNNIFIGIIKRSDLISYMYNKLFLEKVREA